MKRQSIQLARTIIIGILLLVITPQLFASLLNDGSFENNPSDWEEYYNTPCNAISIGNWSSVTGGPPPDGQQSFWAGGICQNDVIANNGVRQDITFQPDAALLSFWYLPVNQIPDIQNEDFAIVSFNDTPIWGLKVDGVTSPPEWTNALVDITSLANQSGTFSIEMQQNNDPAIAHVFFDYLEVLHPSITVSQVISPEAMLLNDNFSIEVTVENSRDTFLSNISVTNDLFFDCDRAVGTLPDLDIGESVTYSCDVTNASPDMENTALASAITTDIAFVVEDSNVVAPIILDPLLALTVAPASASITEGESIIFEMTLNNSGNTPLTNVQVTSPQATGCNLSLGALAVGQTAVFNCSYTPSNSETITFAATAIEPITGTDVFVETAVAIEVQPIDPPAIPTYTLFLPTIANNYINHNALGEPNNSCSQAFPVALNQPANFLAEDSDDWYQFTLNTTSDLTVALTNFVPIAGQITLWSGDCNNLTLVGQNGDFSSTKTISVTNLPTGTYIVWLINDGPINSTDLYTLSITTP